MVPKRRQRGGRVSSAAEEQQARESEVGGGHGPTRVGQQAARQAGQTGGNKTYNIDTMWVGQGHQGGGVGMGRISVHPQ